MAATKKCQKYSELSTAHLFLPIAVETLGPMNDSAYEFFKIIGRKITDMAAIAEKFHFFFKACQSLYRAPMRPCFVTRSLCMTIQTSGRSTAFTSFVLDLNYPG